MSQRSWQGHVHPAWTWAPRALEAGDGLGVPVPASAKGLGTNAEQGRCLLCSHPGSPESSGGSLQPWWGCGAAWSSRGWVARTWPVQCPLYRIHLLSKWGQSSALVIKCHFHKRQGPSLHHSCRNRDASAGLVAAGPPPHGRGWHSSCQLPVLVAPGRASGGRVSCEWE